MTDQEQQFVDWIQSLRAWAKKNQEQMDEATKFRLNNDYDYALRTRNKAIATVDGALTAMAYLASNETKTRILAALKEIDQ